MSGTDEATDTRERPGMSAFALEDGIVYHTYSAYARGLDGLWGMYQWLDRAPRGRNERASGGAVTTSIPNFERRFTARGLAGSDCRFVVRQPHSPFCRRHSLMKRSRMLVRLTACAAIVSMGGAIGARQVPLQQDPQAIGPALRPAVMGPSGGSRRGIR